MATLKVEKSGPELFSFQLQWKAEGGKIRRESLRFDTKGEIATKELELRTYALGWATTGDPGESFKYTVTLDDNELEANEGKFTNDSEGSRWRNPGRGQVVRAVGRFTIAAALVLPVAAGAQQVTQRDAAIVGQKYVGAPGGTAPTDASRPGIDAVLEGTSGDADVSIRVGTKWRNTMLDAALSSGKKDGDPLTSVAEGLLGVTPFMARRGFLR